MRTAWLIVPVLAVGLGGCLGSSGGPNPNCSVTSLPGSGAHRMCTINGLVFVEPIGAGMASMPAPEEEPLVISASDPQPVEPAPAGAEPVADDDLDGEPMVITSQTENPFPNARVPQPRPYPQIVF